MTLGPEQVFGAWSQRPSSTADHAHHAKQNLGIPAWGSRPNGTSSWGRKALRATKPFCGMLKKCPTTARISCRGGKRLAEKRRKARQQQTPASQQQTPASQQLRLRSVGWVMLEEIGLASSHQKSLCSHRYSH
jgi:hypothetical protein